MAFALGPVLALLLFIPPVILSFKTANRGNPATDFPILLNALKKSRARSSSAEADIEAALRILTGLELPEKTSIQQWQKAFN
jgi:hypothetical protein